MPEYTETPAVAQERELRFTYHSPNPNQVSRMKELREAACELARLINVNVPVSREQFAALTHLEQTVMMANAGIVRREETSPEDLSTR